MKIAGLHHVTAIASAPQPNLDFYVGVLGLRLVKRTVNFDDPGTYHFYFADAVGSPGTVLTFFPWPGARKGRRGTGEVEATAFAVRPESLDYWRKRLETSLVRVETMPDRFGEKVLRFADPDGLALELVGSAPVGQSEAWSASEIPAEHALGAFHSVSAVLEGYERTAQVLTDVFGYELVGEAGNRFRFAASAGEAVDGRCIDLICAPGSPRASGGAGSVHHIAFRVKDDDAQLAWRRQLVELGHNVSPVMDRTYFHSIYFREPGGVLFELATDGPGFAFDESPETLGEALRLPPAVEAQRPRIEQILPPIVLPRPQAS